MQPSVEYLGYIIDSEGLHATPKKVEAVLQAPRPISFLGLVTYYCKFIKNLSTIAAPLNRLLCKDQPWRWENKCEKAFTELKNKLASTEVLVHYDPSLPLKLACDASSYRIGALISHIFPDKTEKTIAYASRTLTSTERNYPQIEIWCKTLSYLFIRPQIYLGNRPQAIVYNSSSK